MFAMQDVEKKACYKSEYVAAKCEKCCKECELCRGQEDSCVDCWLPRQKLPSSLQKMGMLEPCSSVKAMGSTTGPVMLAGGRLHT